MVTAWANGFGSRAYVEVDANSCLPRNVRRFQVNVKRIRAPARCVEERDVAFRVGLDRVVEDVPLLAPRKLQTGQKRKGMRWDVGKGLGIESPVP